MLRKLLDLLRFRCSHVSVTFPQSRGGGPAHVTCLRCGREFGYDWATMRVTGPVTTPKPTP